jgi:hypothetical protein
MESLPEQDTGTPGNGYTFFAVLTVGFGVFIAAVAAGIFACRGAGRPARR